MVKFAYSNTKNISIDYMLFELNYSYHFYTSYKKHINLNIKPKSVEKPLTKFKKLITIY